MNDPHNLELTEAELVSGLWTKLRRHFEARLDLNRRKNDSDLSPAETAELRGRIAELKYLLAAGERRD